MRRFVSRSLFDNKPKGFLYLLPALVIYICFFIIPVTKTFISSFFTFPTTSERTFVWFANYAELLKDELFWLSLKNNGIMIFYMMVVPGIFGLILATVFEISNPKAGKLFEVSFFMPQILSLVVVGVIWKWIYNPVFGILNRLLALAGFDNSGQAWLGSTKTAIHAVGFTGIWVNYGFAMVIFLAGYKRIPKSFFEAAALDGAGFWRKFFYISLPSLRGEISVVFTYLFIQALKTFDLIYVMTKGGPGNATSVISLYVFKNAFQYDRLGYAASIAIYLLIFITLGSFLIDKVIKKRSYE